MTKQQMTNKQWMLTLLLLITLSACGLLEKDETTSNGDAASQGWQTVANGVDYRTLSTTPSNTSAFEMHILRIDPNQVRFRAHYQAGRAKSYTSWEEQLAPDAVAFVNGNFFDENNVAIGMVIADGVLSGTTLVGFGGMFAVNGSGVPTIAALARTPYQGAGYAQAVQSFPMLIDPGGVAASTGQGFDDPARRTVIARSNDGTVYWMSTGLFGQISLRDLQTWLLESDLDLDAAFALDGGRSSLMYVRTDPPLQIPSITNVPVVLAIYER